MGGLSRHQRSSLLLWASLLLCSRFAGRAAGFQEQCVTDASGANLVWVGATEAELVEHKVFPRVMCWRSPPCVHLEYLTDPKVCEDPQLFDEHWPGQVGSSRVRGAAGPAGRRPSHCSPLPLSGPRSCRPVRAIRGLDPPPAARPRPPELQDVARRD